MTDRLRWWEEIPLGLALLAQSYVVGLWYYASIKGAGPEVDLAVAIAAGLALDLIVVTTVMGRRAGRSSGWSWATSFGAFGCSSLIALDRYGWRRLAHEPFARHLLELALQRAERPGVAANALGKLLQRLGVHSEQRLQPAILKAIDQQVRRLGGGVIQIQLFL